MRTNVFLAALFLSSGASAQELVVNYLGGVQSVGTGIGAAVPNRGALGVSGNGRYLALTQAARKLVLRYDLQENTVTPFTISALVEGGNFSTSQSITGIKVNNDGSIFLPIGTQIASINLAGQVTVPAINFTPQGWPLSRLPAIYTLPDGAARNNVTGIVGYSLGLTRFYPSMPSNFIIVGTLGQCTSFPCDNAALPDNSQAGNYRASDVWGVAYYSASNRSTIYFTDPENGNRSSLDGIVALIQTGATVSIVAHSSLAAIPRAVSGRRLAQPTGIVVDPSGNLFIADTGNHRILRRSSTGTWSVYAGTGTRGSSGDGGPAIRAEFFEPKALALDEAGVLYIHDSGNALLRRVRPDGLIDTVNRLQTTDGSAGATITVNSFPFPNVSAITAAPSGEIYVATDQRIARVDRAGRVTFVAGSGAIGAAGEDVPATEAPIQFANLNGLATDWEGRLVWAELTRLRVLDPNGRARTLAGRGVQLSGTESTFDADPVQPLAANLAPFRLASTPNGAIVMVSGSGWIRRLTKDAVTTVGGPPWCAGIGEGIPAFLSCTGTSTGGISADSTGAVWLEGNRGQSIRIIDPQGYIRTLANLSGLRVRALAVPPGSSFAYALAYPTGTSSTPANRLLRIGSDGSVQPITAAAVSNQPLNPGQSATTYALLSTDVLAADFRRFAYFPDPVNRRIVVIGPPSEVRIESDPPGAEVMVDGTRVTTPTLLRWLPGEYHTIQAPSDLNGNAFLGWSHAPPSAEPPLSVTWMPPGGPSTVTAQYAASTPVEPELSRKRR